MSAWITQYSFFTIRNETSHSERSAAPLMTENRHATRAIRLLAKNIRDAIILPFSGKASRQPAVINDGKTDKTANTLAGWPSKSKPSAIDRTHL